MNTNPQTFRTVRALAFDLDGTLADSAPGLAQALDQALSALKLPAAGLQRITSWIGNGADILMERALNWIQQQNPGHNTATVQQQQLRQLFDHYYQTTATAGTLLYDGVADTLQQLVAQRLPLALVTNKPSKFVAPVLQALHIDLYFSLVLGGDDVTMKKPHPEALHKVLDKFQINAQQLLFVGDSRNDILAAKAAGCPCAGMSYGYNYGEPIAQSNPDLVLDRFTDLLALIPLSDS